MKKSDFDLYYLIICARGAGSETIVVEKLHQHNLAGFEFEEDARKTYKKYGVVEAFADCTDEGPIICIPKGKHPNEVLKGILGLMMRDEREYDEDDSNVVNPFVSACVRAFLPKRYGNYESRGNVSSWTSYNAWRSLEAEVPSRRQFDLLVDTFGLDELKKWDCKVIKEALRFGKKLLPTRDFRGC